MRKILMTGARNPTVLELTRLLQQPDTQIYLADSVAYPPARYSRHVQKYFKVPKVVFEPLKFVDAILDIVRENQISTYIPTYEEIFTIAQYKQRFPSYCEVYCDSLKKLVSFHNKWLFSNLSKSFSIPTPTTIYFENASKVEKFEGHPEEYVFKPVYSRFATQIMINPSRRTLKKAKKVNSGAWIAQKYIYGREYCCYGIVHHGELKAFTTYHHSFQLGKGSGIYLHLAENKEIENFVIDFCRHFSYHGQIGFDFIHNEKDNKMYVLECNPRTVSGIHFFSEPDQLLDAFLGRNQSVIYPSKIHPQTNILPFLFYNGPKSLIENKFVDWMKAVYYGKDVIYRKDDQKPLNRQFHSLVEFIFLSLKYKVKLSDAISYDIAWNGQSLEKQLIKYIDKNNFENLLTA